MVFSSVNYIADRKALDKIDAADSEEVRAAAEEARIAATHPRPDSLAGPRKESFMRRPLLWVSLLF